MLDDVMFDVATALSLEILSTRISAPIYEYLFSYKAPFGMMKSLFQVEEGELWTLSRVGWTDFFLLFITKHSLVTRYYVTYSDCDAILIILL